MNCAYHPINVANARCSACLRGLCPACDHRIKGYAYCQDCIVAGIEILRRGARQDPQHNSRAGEKSPGVAALLGLVPGLGAAYNGQNIKALVHFAVIVGLWQIADILQVLFFGFAGVCNGQPGQYIQSNRDYAHFPERPAKSCAFLRQ